MKTEKRRIGDIGESAACEFLKQRGFTILDRNYLRKWGEIDIVAQKGPVIHFVEVKSVSCVTLDIVQHSVLHNEVTHGTLRHDQGKQDSYRPEENVHPAKLKRLARTLQTYLLEKRLDSEWQLDIAVVRIDEKARKAKVEILENIII